MNKKKILFVTSRSPFSHIFSGDRERAKTIIEHLKKKNDLDIVYSDNLKGFDKNKNPKKIFFKRNFFDKVKGLVFSILNLQPLQLGYFYSKGVQNYLEENHEQYETIIFHLIRTAQYLPKEFMGKRILEMTDVMSKNYKFIGEKPFHSQKP